MMVLSDQNPLWLRDPDGFLPPDEVHIWQTALTVPKNGMDSLRQLLEPAEQERASRFKVEHACDEFMISRAFLRQTLAVYLKIGASEVRFRTTLHGKPELDGGNDLRFNLSHSGGVAIIAIVRGREIGIDVERIRDDVNALELADRFFSEPEVAWLRSRPIADRSSSFFACWTAKEAYVKAHGEGLSLPLSDFSVIPRRNTSELPWEKLQLEVFGNAEESKRWSMWQLNLGPKFRAALAVEGGNCRLRLGQWTGESH